MTNCKACDGTGQTYTDSEVYSMGSCCCWSCKTCDCEMCADDDAIDAAERHLTQISDAAAADGTRPNQRNRLFTTIDKLRNAKRKVDHEKRR